MERHIGKYEFLNESILKKTRDELLLRRRRDESASTQAAAKLPLASVSSRSTNDVPATTEGDADLDDDDTSSSPLGLTDQDFRELVVEASDEAYVVVEESEITGEFAHVDVRERDGKTCGGVEGVETYTETSLSVDIVRSMKGWCVAVIAVGAVVGGVGVGVGVGLVWKREIARRMDHYRELVAEEDAVRLERMRNQMEYTSVGKERLLPEGRVI